MPAQQAESIIVELEDAVRSGSSEKRVNTLRQVTDLFLHDGEQLSGDQIKVFDDMLCLLTARVEGFVSIFRSFFSAIFCDVRPTRYVPD
jgi:hypothetical protein